MYHLKSFGTQSDVATSQTLTLSLSDLNAVQSGISPATRFSWRRISLLLPLCDTKADAFFKEIIAI